MATFEQLVAAQQELGEAIFTIVRNFKKDSSDRKANVKYYEERIQRLKEATSRFQDLDQQIRAIPQAPMNHDYFSKNYYTEVMAVATKYKSEFETALKTLSETTISAAVGEETNDNQRLVRRLSALIAAARRMCIRIAEDTADHPKQHYEVKLETLQRMWQQAEALNLDIWELCADPASVGYNEAAYNSIEEQVQGVLTELSLKAESTPSHGTRSCDKPSALNASVTSSLQLPRINIPSFNGDYLKWRQFFDLFNQLVHNQPLPTIQKMWYLKMNVSGDAEKLIRHLSLSEANYETAWKMLQERYNNMRILTSTLIQKLLDQPTMLPSAPSIKILHDTTKECLLALNNLGIVTSSWDPLLLHILIKKVDRTTYLAFEQSLKSPRELPTIEEFMSFLEKRFQSLESFSQRERTIASHSMQRSVTSGAAVRQLTTICQSCKKGTHQLYACQVFLQLKPAERCSFVRKQNLCLNCLKPGHMAGRCTSRNCMKCDKKHNTLLHMDSNSSNATNDNQQRSEENKVNSSTKVEQYSRATSLSVAQDYSSRFYVLLGTAVIKLVANNGQEVECRAILDSGSQVNLVTERIVKKLGITCSKTSMSIQGIGQGTKKTDHRINVCVQSSQNNFKTRLEAFVLQNIISQQPSHSIDISQWTIPSNINLADPKFHHPQAIDVLLGAELYYQLLMVGQISLGKNLPVLQNTVFGWIVSGRVNNSKEIESLQCGVCVTEESNLEEGIERLWKMEEVVVADQPRSKAEHQCEVQFTQNMSRLIKGNFMVKLPFADSPERLGESQGVAFNRFLSLERRLSKDETLRQQYVAFMDEYETLGHMTKIDKESILTPNYFVPHHCVVKPDSATTKLRVVFDASAKGSLGASLNDILHTGPVIQDDLFSTLLRFRFPRFVFTTDIKKMYRQILVHPEDRRYQLIIWRRRPSEPVNYYELNTVTYGTRPAPYLAIRCLKQLVTENSNSYPLGAQFLDKNFYVDDGLGGSDNLSTAIETQRQLVHILNSGGFTLHKWSANQRQLLQGVVEDNQEKNLDLSSEQNMINTLGLAWLPNEDKFCIKVNLSPHKRITKRTVSSDLARLFDPLGILAPIVVMAKIFIQELWQLKLAWDESLSIEHHTRWTSFREDLMEVSNFKIARHIFDWNRPKSMQMHVFVDASEKAFGAAIYIRFLGAENKVAVRLLCAKSRVAPLKRQTLPRLELCAALLGAQLATRVTKDLNRADISTIYWTDSTIVLSWINSNSVSYQTFVANRIAAIQEATLPEQWRHVSSQHNPADVLSRGMSPTKLIGCNLWLYGPVFLHGVEENWPPKFIPSLSIANDMERKRTMPASASLIVSADPSTIVYTIQHRNSFTTLQRVIGYIIRIVKRFKGVSDSNQLQLSPQELNDSLVFIVKTIQQSEFLEEIKVLSKGEQVHKSSTLASLNPFLDERGVIRVGGRLTTATISYDAKHPMLLPYNDPIVKLLIQRVHVTHLHCGPQLLLALVRQRFWPIKGKLMVRSIVQHCVKCSRANPKLLNQVMGNLPPERISPARPFINSGVDYCGPFEVHYKIRGKRPHKAYIAIFCCFATKAVHFELVSDLTTAAFIGAIKRFISRRGHCQNIFCDNATNFVGAKNELYHLYSSEAREEIINACCTKSINFHFIPPRSPHFGGLWESAVKSAKYLLTRSVSTASLTYEELETVAIEIEAILNSRPLTEMSADPNDLTALTPGHFLIGEPLTAQVDPSSKQISTSVQTRWKLVTQLKHEFWRRWSTEYLNQLQQRAKWRTHSPNIKPDTMVIIKEDNIPPLNWPLGRVTKVYKGDDGYVRVVKVKTATGEWKRPIHRLSPLPIKVESVELPSDPLDGSAGSEQQGVSNPKRRKCDATNTLVALLCILFVLPLAIAAPFAITRYDTTPGIHFEGLGTVKLTTAEWNLVAFFDLKRLQSNLITFKRGTAAIGRLCQHMNNYTNCNALRDQFLLDLEQLKSNDKIMKSRRQRRGAVNLIGNIANTLFGLLDSTYAEQMSATIDQITDNQEHLLTLLKNQTSVVDSTINLIKEDQRAITTKFDEIDKQLTEVERILNKQQDYFSKQRGFQIYTSLALQLTIIRAELKQTQTAILSILTDVNHGKIHPLLLSPIQLTEEIGKIRNHLPSTLQLPVERENLVTIYKLLKVSAGVSDNHLIFNIRIPLIDDRRFQLFNLIPIPRLTQGMLIAPTLSTQYLAISPHRDVYFPTNATLIQSCAMVNDITYLCYDVRTTYSQGSGVVECEVGFFNNDTKLDCEYEEFKRDLSWTPMLRTNEWIFATKTPIRVNAVCGAESLQFTLSNVGCLSLQPNCIIKSNQITTHSFQRFNSSIAISYTSLTEFKTNETIDRFNHSSLTKTQFISKFDELSALQERLEEQGRMEIHQLRKNDHHQFTIGYLSLAIGIAAAIALLWNWIRSRPTVPKPSPRHSQPFEVVAD